MSAVARWGRPVVAAAMLLAALVGGWWVSRSGLPGAEGPAGVLPPPELGGLPLVHLQRGEEALQVINRLHATSIEIADGYVATYGRGHEQVIVWWSRAASQARAVELVEAMTEKMAANPMFSRPEPVTAEGRRLYSTAGAGMRHYYWASGTDVYWVGMVSSREEAILEALLKGR